MWEQKEEEEREGGGVHNPTMQMSRSGKVKEVYPLVHSWCIGITKSAPAGANLNTHRGCYRMFCGSAWARART